eukprot:12909048-Alexandrium_andersonii.AAC.1
MALRGVRPAGLGRRYEGIQVHLLGLAGEHALELAALVVEQLARRASPGEPVPLELAPDPRSREL